MNIKKRIFIVAIAVILIVGSAALIQFLKTKKETGDNNKVYKIGLAQIVEHPSLNLIRDSFLKRLEDLGYKDNIKILKDSANGEVNMLSTIMQKYKSENVDVIVPIATSTAVAAAQYADKIPIVFSAVSDPISANLTTSLEKPDKNITGTSDEIQVSMIVDLMKKTYPDIKKIGVIYNASESNSVSTVNKLKEHIKSCGIECKETTVSNTSELSQAASTLLSDCDGLFSPIDNTVASGIDAVANTAMNAKKPFFVAADSMVKDNGFATVGIDYEQVGIETANMVDKILRGEKVENIPIKIFKDGLNIYINEGVADKIGFNIPDDIKNSKNYKNFPLKN